MLLLLFFLVSEARVIDYAAVYYRFAMDCY